MYYAIMRRAFLCTIVLLGFTFLATAQKITGSVFSAAGQPLPGVSVQLRGSTAGTSTDAEGNFTMPNVPTGSTLEVSASGFLSQTVKVTGTTVAITLQSTVSNIEEVVVVGYGTQRKKDLTGAVGSVSAKDFNKGFVTAPDQLIQNKVAGLEITSNSGQPGVATTIKIRGNNSIRAVNNPLYVVDGVPLDGRTAKPGLNVTQGLGGSPESNPLLYINPNDIAQIDILKDASSAAIYGSRGANGVIAITTKKATGRQTKVEFGSSFGVSAGYMHKYEILNSSEFRSALTKYNVPATNDYGGNYDALKDITQSTLSSDYNLALSSGGDHGQFRASFLASRARGFLKNSQLQRYLGSFGGQYDFLNKRLKLAFNGRVGNTTEDMVAVSNNADSKGNLISSALSWNPTQNYYNADGTFVTPSNGSGNPLALLKAYDDQAKVVSFLGDISAQVNILKGLDYKFLFGVNTGDGARNTSLAGFLGGYTGISGIGLGVKSYAKLNTQTITHTLNYITPLTSKLELNALAGYEYWKTNYEGSSYSATGFNTNLSELQLTDIKYTAVLGNGSTQNPASVFVNPTVELQSYFGRAILNYDSKYVLTATMRADGSSKFGKNNRYGYFPSVAAKWNISSEEFLADNRTISNLGLRASYGITGNQEFPAGAAQEQYGFNTNSGQVNVANPDLQWEETKSYNFGLDFGFLNGRIYGSLDYYNKNTSEILFQTTAIQPAPAAVFYSNLKDAELINKGIEFAIGGAIVNKPDFTWDVNFNISNNDNKLTNFTQSGNDILINTGQINGQGVSGTLAQVITNNQPVNEFYLKPFQGFDASGNQLVGDNPIFSGDPNPSTIYGIGTSLRYKNASLSINGGGASGFLIYNNTATNITNLAGISGGRNIDKAAYNSGEGISSSAKASTRFLEKGDYFKLRNATLRYNFGNVNSYIKGLSLFVAGNNLFVITKFTGFDPEVNIDKSNNNYPSRSIEYIPYPTPRTITFGFSASL